MNRGLVVFAFNGSLLATAAIGGGLKVRLHQPVAGLDLSRVVHINNNGEVSFNSSSDSTNDSIGAVWREGEVFTVPFAGRNTVGMINASGLVSGTGITSNVSRGFRWRPGGDFELLEPLAGTVSLPATGTAGALSDGGVAGGSSRHSDLNRVHAVLYPANSSSPTDLTPNSSTHTFVRGVNSSGDVLMSFNNSNFSVQRNGVAFTTLGVAGSTGFTMLSMNESTKVAGFVSFSFPSFFSQAARWELSGQNMVPFTLPLLAGRGSAIANAVNRHGDAAGRAYQNTFPTSPVAVAWINNVPIDLNTVIEPVPGLVLTEAFCINDNREVGGVGLYLGSEVGFVVHLGDSDGDGLLDTWEAEGGGIDGNDDGTPDLNLHALGARPDHKDLFVEIDHGAISGFPNGVVRRVVDAFAAAPVENPDGTNGIRLHLIRDESNLPIPVQSFPAGGWPDNFSSLKAQYFGTPAERAKPEVIAAKRRAFRYCIGFHRNDGISGIAEIAGNDMAVFFGNNRYHDGFRDLDEMAILFMHEFGHTLGLRHGGADNVNCKPNYPSVMNYSLADVLPFNAGFIRIDFSRSNFEQLDESNLDESRGVRATDPASSLYRGFFMPFGFGAAPRGAVLARLDGEPVDWSVNGVPSDTAVVQDLNYMDPATPGWQIAGTTTPSAGQIMAGHDDWSNITYVVGRFGDNADLSNVRREVPHELGPDDFAALGSIVPPPPIPAFFARSDFNDDDLVDDTDFQIFIVGYNELIVPPAEDRCDINGDDFVDDADFQIFVVAYNMLVPGG